MNFLAKSLLVEPGGAAFAWATATQSICSLCLTIGLLARLNAFLLGAILGVAVLQNVLTRRDPHLPVLYVLIAVSMIFLGGGRYSIDALLAPVLTP